MAPLRGSSPRSGVRGLAEPPLPPSGPLRGPPPPEGGGIAEPIAPLRGSSPRSGVRGLAEPRAPERPQWRMGRARSRDGGGVWRKSPAIPSRALQLGQRITSSSGPSAGGSKKAPQGLHFQPWAGRSTGLGSRKGRGARGGLAGRSAFRGVRGWGPRGRVTWTPGFRLRVRRLGGSSVMALPDRGQPRRPAWEHRDGTASPVRTGDL